MLIVTAAAILTVMLLALIRAQLGPTVYDRILALNVFGTKTVLLISVVGYLSGRPDFLDVALVYALINFISVIGVLRYFQYTENHSSKNHGSVDQCREGQHNEIITQEKES